MIKHKYFYISIVLVVLVVLTSAYVIIPKSWFSDITSDLIGITLFGLLTAFLVYLITIKEDSRN